LWTLQLLPGWRGELIKTHFDAESAVTAARKLVKWCHEHNGGKVVGKRDPSVIDDSESRMKWSNILRAFRRAALGGNDHQFPEAFQVLDEAFGADGWRAGQGMIMSIHAD
jgi:hypothetical protein